MKTRQFMAINQYGETFHGLTHPRKDLCERLNCKHADKMYIDNNDGISYHVGYVIANNWLNVYEVIPMKNKVQ